ncbi:hypothetical protein GCK72_018729 [Caenorhabditis remanei]|uniref:Piwi domain-containing protein n=1 Tax=Caenorhabditis remanei TaxID=31234 RepID=A0A6A5GC40_CAERE|nr:hypothetical protein GCK72_018729 [Caenorhabditis remanei]KAF1752175.1 hypothetical protein GCK72_018729 [Caenorhabditis remanei]
MTTYKIIKAIDECSQRLGELNIQPAPKIYPNPSDPGKFSNEIDIQTNIFGLEVDKKTELFQYIVSIKADLTVKKEVIFTKKGKEDFVVVDRHEKCATIISHAFRKFSDFFKTDKNCLIYDGQSVLFSSINLFEGFPDSQTKTKQIQINGTELSHLDLQNLPYIKLEVYSSKNPPIVLSAESLGQRTANSNLDANNRAYSQILELALCQSGIRKTLKGVCFENGKLFFIKPLEDGFVREDIVDVGDGKSMLPGIKRTIQFIEGPYGRGNNNPAIVIDASKVAFHKEQLVMDKIAEIILKNPTLGIQEFEREKCIPVIRGLDCYSTYSGRTRHLKIEGIHPLDASTARFELKDGGNCTVEKYFEERYKIKLRHPRANLLICKHRGNQNFFPMELMTITKNQRESAVLPDVRQRLIMTGMAAADICSKNYILSELGVNVCPEPLMAKGQLLPPNRIQFSTQNTEATSGKWRFSGFVRPSEPPKIWAMYAVGYANNSFSIEIFGKFVSMFMHGCQSKGIQIGEPAESKLVHVDDMENVLEIAGRSDCSFVFVISDDSISHLHQKYKMIERKYEMIVQDMRMSLANNVVTQGKRLTLENVINKTNLKLGGTNYLVMDTKLNDVLVIGVGLSLPTGTSKFVSLGNEILSPLVVGYASNGKTPQEFTGDFVLSPVGEVTISSIEEIITQCLELYNKCRQKLPKRVLVYRSGSSDGAHGTIIAHEIPLARVAIGRFSSAIKLIYVVVSKDHTYRFFKNNLDNIDTASSSSSSSSSGASRTSSRKADQMNIPPGVILDSVVTHPACKQFFLNSHTTLQGTAKTPLYTVLADDCDAKLSTLEEITYNLCHCHQIVGLTTSLPTPLYVANEYAKRGRNLFTERCSVEPVIIGAGSEKSTLEKVTDELSYKEKRGLLDRRINA